MRRNGAGSLIFIVVLTLAAIIGTLVAHNAPLLGLDLQGGVSVVLQPKKKVPNDTLGEAISIIRRRVDALGVAEPSIQRQGNAIVIDLPGVKNRKRALELVGQTAQLRFRPVLQSIPISALADASTSTTAKGGTTTTTAKGATTTTAKPGGTTSTTAATTTTTADEQGLGGAPAPLARPDGGGTTTTTTKGGATTTTTAPPDQLNPLQTTKPADDDPKKPVILDDAENNERFYLGPSLLTGETLSTASAALDQTSGSWSVHVEFKKSGIGEFNKAAALCNGKDPAVCPSGRLAIVLDSVVESAPTIQQPSFKRDEIQITGNFKQREAKDLALVLRYGSLPVPLEAQQTQTISPTLGRDALTAGVASGLVGLALVGLYMIIYYRLLGLIAVFSLAIGAALLWSTIALLGETRGLALTLAGVTGIIVSIGVAVDSNVVFYEHLKEDVAKGRTLRSTVESSFSSAWSTIVKADAASLIGAGLLYMLTVGPVRGFAFYLFLSTVLDLIASYFCMRPMTLMLSRSKRLANRPKWFGLPAGSMVSNVTGAET